jgi:hypothetical protein
MQLSVGRRRSFRIVDNLRIAGGHAIFAVENGFSIAQKWLYIITKTTFKKINHFFERKKFPRKSSMGTLATFFEKIVLLENVFCHTSFDAVSRADFEYHLSVALSFYFKGKKGSGG